MSAEPPNSIVTALAFVGRTDGAVRSLPGFQKGRHTLPTAVTAASCQRSDRRGRAAIIAGRSNIAA